MNSASIAKSRRNIIEPPPILNNRAKRRALIFTKPSKRRQSAEYLQYFLALASKHGIFPKSVYEIGDFKQGVALWRLRFGIRRIIALLIAIVEVTPERTEGQRTEFGDHSPPPPDWSLTRIPTTKPNAPNPA